MFGDIFRMDKIERTWLEGKLMNVSSDKLYVGSSNFPGQYPRHDDADEGAIDEDHMVEVA
ncbi:MAG: hypothetical protein M3256_03770 [Actinomycetota bacterium]|nr:hypothetical protein [Actinomycetota bacterium]